MRITYLYLCDNIKALPPRKENINMGKNLQTASEPAARPSYSSGNTIDPAIEGRTENKYPVSFSQFTVSNNYSIGFVKRH